MMMKKIDEATVLVVDDDRDIRRLISAALAQAGFAVQMARDGSEALKIASTADQPLIMLVDWMMPGDIDGWDDA